MNRVLSQVLASFTMIGVLLLAPRAVRSGPPPPPGGHIPVYYGGANQAGYPPSSAAIADPASQAAPSLAAVSSAPNPFRGATTIRIPLRAEEVAQVRIFHPTGRLLRELALRAAEPGVQALVWDGRDRTGHPLPSGIYFYQVVVGDHSVTRKLTLLR